MHDWLKAAGLCFLLAVAARAAEAQSGVRQLCSGNMARANACVLVFAPEKSANRIVQAREPRANWFRIEIKSLGDVYLKAVRPGGIKSGRMVMYMAGRQESPRSNAAKLNKLELAWKATPGTYDVLVDAGGAHRLEVAFTATPVFRMICAQAGRSKETPCDLKPAGPSGQLRSASSATKRPAASTLAAPPAWSRTVRGHVMAWDGPEHWYRVRLARPASMHFVLRPARNFVPRFYEAYYEHPRAGQPTKLGSTNGTFEKIYANLEPGDYLIGFRVAPGAIDQWPNLNIAYELSVRIMPPTQ